jgi:BirA family biotin operon repressor/biotin-[acetyl-CoA-carboxylase] ligase
VTSALDLAHRLADEGAPHGTLIVAEEQTAGRGQHGRVWHSPAGGLWMAFVARPATPSELRVVSLRIGLAVAETLAGFVPTASDLGVKWPNDLLLGDRKVGGVLCEARWRGDSLRWVAVGVGINLTNRIPEELASEAVAAGNVHRERLALAIGAALEGLHLAAPLLHAEELERLARVDALRDRALVEPVAGMARGIAADGALLVETSRGIEAVRAGSPRLA